MGHGWRRVRAADGRRRPTGRARCRPAVRRDPVGAAGRRRPAAGRRAGPRRAGRQLHASDRSPATSDGSPSGACSPSTPGCSSLAAVLVVVVERRRPGRPEADGDRASTRACRRITQHLWIVVVVAGAVPRVGARRRARPAGPGEGHRPARRVGHERPADQGLHPPPAPVARLLHRREGRRRHDPDDERHREPPAAPPGRARPVRHPGPDDGRRSRSSCSPTTCGSR